MVSMIFMQKSLSFLVEPLRVIFFQKEFMGLLDLWVFQFDIIFDAIGKISKKDCAHLLKPDGIFMTVEGWDFASESVRNFLFTLFLIQKILHSKGFGFLLSFEKDRRLQFLYC